MVWRLWSEPPDLVQTGSGTRMDLPALCPEQSGAKPAAPSSMGTQSYRSSLDVYEDPVRQLGQSRVPACRSSAAAASSATDASASRALP